MASLQLSSGAAEDQGVRASMEDETMRVDVLSPAFEPHGFYAVYDGHAGREAASHCRKHLHKHLAAHPAYGEDPRTAFTATFRAMDREVCLTHESAGTTAAVALVRGTSLLAAWVGDSRVIVGRTDGSVLDVTTDHKPSGEAETARIVRAGGRVNGGMVNGTLAVSRAIGDAPFKYAWRKEDADSDDDDDEEEEEEEEEKEEEEGKDGDDDDEPGDDDKNGSDDESYSEESYTAAGAMDPFQTAPSGGPSFPWRDRRRQVVSSAPEFAETTLEPERDAFIIIACDGLFDVLPSAKVVELAAKCVAKGMKPAEIARELVDLALDYETVDNVSIVFVLLQWGGGKAGVKAKAKASFKK
jgi:serine/threonine protein phosphatase PrpC